MKMSSLKIFAYKNLHSFYSGHAFGPMISLSISAFIVKTLEKKNPFFFLSEVSSFANNVDCN